jgi:hypothetical protein
MPIYTIKPLVTATAINTGGRNGHSETTDHSVSVNLSVPKEMGGPGLPDTATPEQCSPLVTPPVSAGRSSLSRDSTRRM